MATLDVRAWLARQLGCRPAGLRRIGLVERSADGTLRTTYRCGAQATRVSIGPRGGTSLVRTAAS